MRCSLDGQPTVETEHDPLVGSAIDRYRLEERLGVGRMGCVYRARHVVLEREYALKIFFGDFAKDERFRARFKKAAQTISRIRHPNVVSVDDFGTTPAGLTFWAMELVRGRSLDSVLDSEGPLAAARAASITRQLAAGLGAAHRIGLAHHELKPKNVMLTRGPEGEQVKLLAIDAVALHGDDVRGPNGGFGIDGSRALHEYGPRADVHALGMMLFEMLAGAPPQPGHLDALPPSRGLETLVRRLLDPHHPSLSAEEVISELDRLGNGAAPPAADEITGVTLAVSPPAFEHRPILSRDQSTGVTLEVSPPAFEHRPILSGNQSPGNFQDAPTDYLPDERSARSISGESSQANADAGEGADADSPSALWPSWIEESRRDPLPSMLLADLEMISDPVILEHPAEGLLGEPEAHGAEETRAFNRREPNLQLLTHRPPLSGPRAHPDAEPEPTMMERRRPTTRGASRPPHAALDDLLFEPSRPIKLSAAHVESDSEPTQIDFLLEEEAAPAHILSGALRGTPQASTAEKAREVKHDENRSAEPVYFGGFEPDHNTDAAVTLIDSSLFEIVGPDSLPEVSPLRLAALEDGTDAARSAPPWAATPAPLAPTNLSASGQASERPSSRESRSPVRLPVSVMAPSSDAHNVAPKAADRQPLRAPERPALRRPAPAAPRRSPWTIAALVMAFAALVLTAATFFFGPGT